MTLQERRRAKDMALGELARKCNLGTMVMSRIERGLEDPPEAILKDIAAVLGCTVDDVKAGLPSVEEVAQSNKRFEELVSAMGAAQADAKAKGFGKGNAGRGEIECPVCKGKLRYSVAAVNGHLWGACSNKDCVRWMQ